MQRMLKKSTNSDKGGDAVAEGEVEGWEGGRKETESREGWMDASMTKKKEDAFNRPWSSWRCLVPVRVCLFSVGPGASLRTEACLDGGLSVFRI